MAHQLIKIGENDGTVEGRRAFVDETKLVRCVPEVCPNLSTPSTKRSSILSQIHHDFCLDVAKKVTDARRKVREGFGRGIERICKAQGQGVSLSS
jgi:N-terminal acetyltransferase B complex non-catalytic subunit